MRADVVETGALGAMMLAHTLGTLKQGSTPLVPVQGARVRQDRVVDVQLFTSGDDIVRWLDQHRGSKHLLLHWDREEQELSLFVPGDPGVYPVEIRLQYAVGEGRVFTSFPAVVPAGEAHVDYAAEFASALDAALRGANVCDDDWGKLGAYEPTEEN